MGYREIVSTYASTPFRRRAAIYDHGVAESEVLELLDRPLEQTAGWDDGTILMGRTIAGRLSKSSHLARSFAPSRSIRSGSEPVPEGVNHRDRVVRDAKLGTLSAARFLDGEGACVTSSRSF